MHFSSSRGTATQPRTACRPNQPDTELTPLTDDPAKVTCRTCRRTKEFQSALQPNMDGVVEEIASLASVLLFAFESHDAAASLAEKLAQACERSKQSPRLRTVYAGAAQLLRYELTKDGGR